MSLSITSTLLKYFSAKNFESKIEFGLAKEFFLFPDIKLKVKTSKVSGLTLKKPFSLKSSSFAFKTVTQYISQWFSARGIVLGVAAGRNLCG